MREETAKNYAEEIRQASKDLVMKEQSVRNNRPYCYASGYHPCVRYHIYTFTEADKLPLYDSETMAKFRRGTDRERDILADLSRAGRLCEPQFDVISQQMPYRVCDRKNRIAISGKVDACLKFKDGTMSPIEIKTWNQNLTERVKCFSDLFDNQWTRKGAYQLICYLLASNEPIGYMVLDRPGLPLILPVSLYEHLGRAEEFLDIAEKAQDYKESGIMPERIDDISECKFCEFKDICNPKTGYGEGVQVIVDKDIHDLLEKIEETKEAAKEYDRCNTLIKERFRGISTVLCGDFMATGKWGKSVRYDVPDEIKQQYKVEDSKGRFTLKIEKL